MKKLLLLKTVLLLSSFFISAAFGQSASVMDRAYVFIQSEYGLDRASIGDLKIKDQYRDDLTQVEHVYLVQAYKGHEILGTSVNLTFLPNGKITCVGHRLTPLQGYKVKNTEPVVIATEAIHVAAQSLGITSRSIPTVARVTDKGVSVYQKTDISLQDIPIELGYLITSTGELQLVWKLMIDSGRSGELYQSYVDATTGKSIANDLMTLHCSFEEGYLAHSDACEDAAEIMPAFSPMPPGIGGQYRVLPLGIESPNHGAFELLSGTEDPVASPFGWHDVNGVAGADYTSTQGNNVHAFLDRNWDYAPDGVVDGGAGLNFDFPYNPNAEPVNNGNVAATNLFYWNNLMHDIAYQYGFTEVAGNFQQTNYSGQGDNQDYVNAHGQFGDNNPTTCGTEVNGGTACLNNADFATPPDGFNGRMRMFTWDIDNGSKYLDVIQPSELAGKILTGLAQFGPDITTVPVTGAVIVINDGTFNASKGCNANIEQPALAGKIALIDRGLCDFSAKVYNAQRAGAIGAIICNFEDATITMAAGDNATSVTIPSVFISSVECERIRIAAGSGLVVSLVAPSSGGPVFRDGCLDNSIISHEYGHGISTRITGGPGDSGCLSPGALGNAQEAYGMGEGWSDFFALITTVQPGDEGAKRRGIGTYAFKEPTNGRGIRTYPYTTDMAINPHTYNAIITEAESHGVGSVWCAMLWDLYWAFSDAYGWDPDLYHGTGGNNTAIQLVMDGLKLQPCRPGFTDARNAILQADTINNGGVNACLIWSAFARRGLGVNADQGDPNSWSDGKEGFDVPTTCLDDITFTKTMSPEVVAGEDIEVTIKLTNFKDYTLNNVVIEDPIPQGCSYQSGSANIPPATGNSLVWSINSLAPDASLTISYLLKTDPAKPSIRLIYDDMENAPEDRWDITYDPAGTTDNFWYPQDVIVHSGVSAWNVGDVATESEHFLTNLEAFSITGNYPLYRFYHYYNTEPGADGGFLEISTNGGQAWIPLENRVFRNGYPGKLAYGTFAIPNLLAFSGLSSTSLKMTPVYIDLSDYIGEEVNIRYRFGTDAQNGGDGWYMDDVEIMDAVVYNSQACFSSDESETICAEAPERGTIVDTQITIGTDDGQSSSAFEVMPNPAGDVIQVVMTSARNEDASVHIYNLTGHLLSSSAWSLAEGVNQKTIDISRLTSGMYVIQVETKSGIRSEKFVKE